MIVAPYVLAVVFGLWISLAIYFVAYWPAVEPPGGTGDDDGPAEGLR